MAKSQCGTCGEWFEDSELDDHLNQHVDEPAEPTTEPTRECPNCKTTMDVYRGVPFKIGRSDLATRLLIGWRSELGEEPIMIDMFVCPQCGRILQFADKKTRERLRRSAPHEP